MCGIHGYDRNDALPPADERGLLLMLHSCRSDMHELAEDGAMEATGQCRVTCLCELQMGFHLEKSAQGAP